MLTSLQKLASSSLFSLFSLFLASGITLAQPALPNFATAVFSSSLHITNPLFPQVPGTVLTYDQVMIDPVLGEVPSEHIVVEVLAEARQVAGITNRVIRDRVWDEDNLLIEDTKDWFAQDDAGNVWYFGEDATSFEYDDAGNLVTTSHAGSWEAGINGAQPGYAMQTAPSVGDFFYQEYAIGVAQDAAQIISLSESINVPAGMFNHVVRTRETTSLNPSSVDDKFYAAGVGRILERGINPLTGSVATITRLVSVVPEPGSAIGFLAILVSVLMRVIRCVQIKKD